MWKATHEEERQKPTANIVDEVIVVVSWNFLHCTLNTMMCALGVYEQWKRHTTTTESLIPQYSKIVEFYFFGRKSHSNCISQIIFNRFVWSIFILDQIEGNEMKAIPDDYTANWKYINIFNLKLLLEFQIEAFSFWAFLNSCTSIRFKICWERGKNKSIVYRFEVIIILFIICSINERAAFWFAIALRVWLWLSFYLLIFACIISNNNYRSLHRVACANNAMQSTKKVTTTTTRRKRKKCCSNEMIVQDIKIPITVAHCNCNSKTDELMWMHSHRGFVSVISKLSIVNTLKTAESLWPLCRTSDPNWSAQHTNERANGRAFRSPVASRQFILSISFPLRVDRPIALLWSN